MLREIDSRVRFLRKRLEKLKVVEQPPADLNRIFFSAHVSLEDEQGDALQVRIVGPDEIDPKRHWISIDSPLARALLGKTVDDEISVQTPTGEKLWWVLGIDYRG